MTKHGEQPMKRRNLHISDKLWRELERYAGELGARRGRPATTSETIHQILSHAIHHQHKQK